jgi:cobalt-zinc-cadmium efflux system membrane fusion protein
MKKYFLTIAIFSGLIFLFIAALPYTKDNHESTIKSEKEHVHEGDSHNEEDHESNSHNEDDHEGDSHSEGETKILTSSIENMGIVIEKSSSVAIDETLPLTGRITINQNSKADIKARFEGVVRNVNFNLGDRVKKGQVLAVVESNESLQNYNILSPITGIILERNTNIGDVVGDNALFVVADLSNVWAKFHIFPRDVSYIKKGQTVSVHTLESDKNFLGKIDMLLPTADELTQTEIAIVSLPNFEKRWKPGMTIEGDVTVSTVKPQVTVKASALQKMEELGDVIFVKEGNSYVPRQIKVGRKNNEYVEITQGLKVGESYVSKGSFIIKSDILKATAAHSH